MIIIRGGVSGLQGQVTTLTQQVAGLTAGEPVTQDQLDALNVSTSSVQDQTDALAAVFAPPAIVPTAAA